ncbi:diatom spindle kinesin 1 [Aaosphaeria arxii CBS 175.79]|uniref:Diatom spindle kinesin 1 n=1 Tax=Aaosphaeria arxii CBS 175.79 TaxID=1450172 RepID=A0A6A5XYL8_9PLEO|nr:diatom spindle kinesin 1 [Aaosphaeria arxii CBS 175.79]KAF2018023.1 diatom spindle kinesin 1 [Aaosphaeria arxii CBS 175.79]
MDQFYQKNASLYQSLVKAVKKPTRAHGTPTSQEEGNQNMVVSARIRPFLEDELNAGFPCAVFPQNAQAGAKTVIDIHDLYNHPKGRPVLKSFNYGVDRIFGTEATTEQIYEDLVKDLIPFAWDGGISTLFAYGQTGSGKTFTISQLERLAVKALMEGDLPGEKEVYLTIIDLAGNSAFDLLSSRSPISILEDSFGVSQLKGAEEYLVQDRAEVMNLIERAASFRRTASTIKNDASSRSHGICRIRIKDVASDTEGLLYLIDLAGSEAARDIAVHGADRMRETREINISLSVLKDCIRGKAESDALLLSGKRKQGQKAPRVPYRQSALTKVLKHVFDPSGGHTTKTVIIACVNPSLADVSPTKNTLRFAELLRVPAPKIGKPNFKPNSPVTWTNAQLQDWIAKNSGTPPINGSILAPTATGAQILKLPARDFETLCLSTDGVSIDQARAFREKLWALHIDSLHNDGRSQDSAGQSAAANTGSEMKSSSQDDGPNVEKLLFKERIRPGMVVCVKKPVGTGETVGTVRGLTMAMILCPTSALDENHRMSLEAKPNPGKAAYLCATVVSTPSAKAYTLHPWEQVVVDVTDMENEIILEYDSSSHNYYMVL